MNKINELDIYDIEKKEFNDFFIKVQSLLIQENQKLFNNCFNNSEKNLLLKELWRKNYNCDLILDFESSKLIFDNKEYKTLFLIKFSN